MLGAVFKADVVLEREGLMRADVKGTWSGKSRARFCVVLFESDCARKL